MGTNRFAKRTDSFEKSATTAVSDGPPPNLSQLLADAIRHAGLSTAAFAHAHDLPYLSLIRLLSSGVPPSDRQVIERLARLIGAPPDVFQASLARARSQPAPAVEAKPSDDAATPLQAALLRVVEQRGLSTKSFADRADLSVLTATRILKGDLPGRAATHEKLRVLLDLDTAAYHRLVEESRAALESPHPEPTVSDALEPTPSSGSLINLVNAHAGNARATRSDELSVLIERLNPRQREALKRFILTLV